MAFDAVRCRAAAKAIKTGAKHAQTAIRELLFPRQQELFESAIRHRQTAAEAGRRSGKTSVLLALIALCGFVGWNIVIVYPNARQARNKMLGKLVRLCRLLGLRVHTRASDGIIELGTRGATLEIGSAHTRDAIDSIRGDGVHIAIIEEPGAMDDDLLVYLMDEVLGPQLMDHMGHWVMTGTPSPVPIGRWTEVTDEEAAAKQANADARWNLIMGWTYHDNPELKDPERTVDAELARMGKTRDSDTYQREYLAKKVSNDSERPLHWTPKNDYDQLPRGEPVLKVAGVDIGWDDEDAIGTLYVYRYPRASIYLVEEDIENRQTDPQLAMKLRTNRTTHSPEITVADSANAKSIANLQAEGIQIIGAKKGRGSVAMGLKQLDNLLREGRFFAKKGSRFAKDAAAIQWKVRGKTLKEKPHSNIIPAVRYGLDEVPAPYFLDPPAPPAPTVFDSPLLKSVLTNPNADPPRYG